MEDDGVTQLNQRALRVVQTRLSNLLGEVSATETTRLLSYELSEVDNGLNLVGALAATGAVAVILAAQALGIAPDYVITQIRTLMTPPAGGG